jgi:hypothetical protein
MQLNIAEGSDCAGIGLNAVEPLLDPDAAAKVLDLSPSWLAKGRMYGYGPDFIQIGRAIRYSRSSLLHFIAARTHQPSERKRRRRRNVKPQRTD